MPSPLNITEVKGGCQTILVVNNQRAVEWLSEAGLRGLCVNCLTNRKHIFHRKGHQNVSKSQDIPL